MEYLCGVLQAAGLDVIARKKKEEDIIINVPPGTSKSTICTIMFPVWLWTVDASITCLTGSYSSSLSLSHSTKSRSIVLCDKFKELFPEVRLKQDQGAKGDYETTKNGARITTSTDGTATGRHAHIIILDDPQNAKLSNSEKERENTNNFVSATLATRKIDKEKTLTIFVQQRLHPRDVTGFLLTRGKRYKHICLPAELNASIKPISLASRYQNDLLDEHRLSRSILDELKTDLGSKNYNTQIGQNPEGDKDSIIKEAWLPIITVSQYMEAILNKRATIDFFVDTAYTDNTKNDPSAIVACTKVDDILYITGADEVWKEFPDFIKYLTSYTESHAYTNQSRVRVEPKATGKSIVQTLEKTSINISEAPAPSTSKLERLNAIAPKVEAMKVRLVEGAWNSKFIGQVTSNYPPHDDIRDCFIMSVEDKLILKANSGKYNMGFV